MEKEFPGGHVEYSFEMYVDHRESIRCKSDVFRINEIVISKLFPDDPFDYKWKLVIFLSEVSSIEEVDSIGDENKDSFFSLISFMLKTGIFNIIKTGHGVFQKKNEGAQIHIIEPLDSCNHIGMSGGRKLKTEEVDSLSKIFVDSRKISNNPLVNIFSYASSVADPVVQFMFFYLILYEIYKKQNLIDNFIMKKFPNTIQLSSPHRKGQKETIFTKIRNDITHRINSSREEVCDEIICNVNKLKEISHLAVMSQITQR